MRMPATLGTEPNPRVEPIWRARTRENATAKRLGTLNSRLPNYGDLSRRLVFRLLLPGTSCSPLLINCGHKSLAFQPTVLGRSNRSCATAPMYGFQNIICAFPIKSLYLVSVNNSRHLPPQKFDSRKSINKIASERRMRKTGCLKKEGTAIVRPHVAKFGPPVLKMATRDGHLPHSHLWQYVMCLSKCHAETNPFACGPFAVITRSTCSRVNGSSRTLSKRQWP